MYKVNKHNTSNAVWDGHGTPLLVCIAAGCSPGVINEKYDDHVKIMTITIFCAL